MVFSQLHGVEKLRDFIIRNNGFITTPHVAHIFQEITWKVISLFLLLGFGAMVGMYGAKFGEHALLLLGAPLLIPLGVLLFIHPRLLFYLLIASRCALDPVLDSARFTSTFGLGAVLNLLLIICAFFLCIQPTQVRAQGSAPVPIQQSLKLWCVPLLMMLLGMLNTPDLIPALKRLMAFTSYFAVFTIGFILVLEGQLKTLLRVVVLSTFIPLGVGFYQMATGTLPADGRLESTFTHPNIYAFYCLLALIVLLYLQRMKADETGSPTSAIEKTAQWFLIACHLLSIILTQTRSAWVALLFMGVVYGVLYSRKTLVGMAVAVGVAALVPAVQDRVMDLFTGNEVVQYAKLNSFAWRQLIWESGLSWMSPSRYLFGYGVGGFFYYSVDFFPLSFGQPYGAHNVFVERLFDGGIVAVVVFAVFFAVQLLAAYQQMKYDGFAALVYTALILSYLVLSSSDNVIDYLSYNWYYWVVAGALYAHARMTISKQKNK